MNKNILIPHEFSKRSLSLVQHAVNKAKNDQIEIVLTHFMFLPNSIIDLLYFSKSELIQSLETPEFKRAYRALVKRNADSNIRIRTDIFSGLNQKAFKHFIEGNSITEAIIPDPYQHALINKDSFDPLPYLRRSRLKITEVPVPQANNVLQLSQQARVWI